ncbi:DUF6484 domain-containing protein [Caballeronia sp. GaOx3]|uniref:DUF6484 domain-containing protein n=1 Tax=Caballeronia sp. GaOx3 TaxID=2921740 RepID=UPI0020289B57|nr:DUF6484 domain-containing protein [Caballeronia sp. GaOx3]
MGHREPSVQTSDIHDAEDLLAQPSPRQADAFALLLRHRPSAGRASALPGIVVGTLAAIADAGRTPLVLFPGPHGNTALAARSVVDLDGGHVGKEVALSFENGDATRPIVMGLFHDESNRPLPAAGHVKIDADGPRMIVAAREQLVLRCGEASITLTRAGKVIIEGSYISSQSEGLNRIKGGSVQLN